LEKKERPFISIIIAVRNEAQVIERCLNSLVAQEYPADNYEILIGNDASTDNTEAIVNGYVGKYKNIKCFFIKDLINGLQGKSNVLAQLTKKAKGTYILFTDADMQLPKNWIVNMLQCSSSKTGILNGYSLPLVNNMFSALQAIDWLMAQKQLQILSKWEIPVTAMGNNMLVKKEAYDSTGGYEALGFSVTEDFQLFRAIVNKGWGFDNAFNKSAPGLTIPEKTISSLISQRLRWMQGALCLPFKIRLLLILQALLLPLIIVLFLFFPVIGLSVMLLRWLLISLFLWYTIEETKQFSFRKYILFYDAYNLTLSFSLLVMYLFKVKLMWKERQYHI